MDVTLFLWINRLGGNIDWLDLLSSYLVNDYLIPVLLSSIVFGLWFSNPDKNRLNFDRLCVLASLLGVGISNAINSVLNQFFSRPRPFETLEMNLLFYPPSDSSFPANPAVVGFALAVGIFLANRWLGSFALFLAGMWGISRIYSGVNFPLDVLVGSLLGGGSTLIVKVGLTYSPVGRMITRKFSKWLN